MFGWIMGSGNANKAVNKSEFIEEEVKDHDDKIGSKVNKYN